MRVFCTCNWEFEQSVIWLTLAQSGFVRSLIWTEFARMERYRPKVLIGFFPKERTPRELTAKRFCAAMGWLSHFQGTVRTTRVWQRHASCTRILPTFLTIAACESRFAFTRVAFRGEAIQARCSLGAGVIAAGVLEKEHIAEVLWYWCESIALNFCVLMSIRNHTLLFVYKMGWRGLSCNLRFARRQFDNPLGYNWVVFYTRRVAGE